MEHTVNTELAPVGFNVLHIFTLYASISSQSNHAFFSLVIWNYHDIVNLLNSVDADQLASLEASWSGSTLFFKEGMNIENGMCSNWSKFEHIWLSPHLIENELLSSGYQSKHLDFYVFQAFNKDNCTLYSIWSSECTII